MKEYLYYMQSKRTSGLKIDFSEKTRRRRKKIELFFFFSGIF